MNNSHWIHIWLPINGIGTTTSVGCPVSGEVYTVGAGRVARFFIGMTEGYFNPKLSVKDVRDHFEQIRDESGYTVPAGPADEFRAFAKAFEG